MWILCADFSPLAYSFWWDSKEDWFEWHDYKCILCDFKSGNLMICTFYHGKCISKAAVIPIMLNQHISPGNATSSPWEMNTISWVSQLSVSHTIAYLKCGNRAKKSAQTNRFLQHNRLLIIAPNTFQVEQLHAFPSLSTTFGTCSSWNIEEKAIYSIDDMESTQFTFNFVLHISQSSCFFLRSP